jgi:hypothetical protein
MVGLLSKIYKGHGGIMRCELLVALHPFLLLLPLTSCLNTRERSGIKTTATGSVFRKTYGPPSQALPLDEQTGDDVAGTSSQAHFTRRG